MVQNPRLLRAVPGGNQRGADGPGRSSDQAPGFVAARVKFLQCTYEHTAFCSATFKYKIVFHDVSFFWGLIFRLNGFLF
jgi:hypothetical protein